MGTLHECILQGILIYLTSVHMAFTESDWLPPPENISIISVNLIHILHWKPVPESWVNVTYFVQSQGEFERHYKNFTWNDLEQCQNISAHQCDVSGDVAASVNYTFRVRSEQGGQRTSVWAEMEKMFNRMDSILIPPNFTLQVHGHNSLTLNIDHLGESFQFFVNFWEKEKENEVKSILLSREVTSTSFDQLKNGNEYCAYVIAFAAPIFKNSSRSHSVCVIVPGLVHKGLIIGLLIALVFALVPLALVARKAIRELRYFCCPEEEIPKVLNESYSSREKTNILYPVQEEYESVNNAELHELINSLEKCMDTCDVLGHCCESTKQDKCQQLIQYSSVNNVIKKREDTSAVVKNLQFKTIEEPICVECK